MNANMRTQNTIIIKYAPTIPKYPKPSKTNLTKSQYFVYAGQKGVNNAREV